LRQAFYSRENIFYCKMRCAVRCVVNFYNAGFVTHSRMIGSWAELKLDFYRDHG
jgi:hypothetical protein